MAPRPRTQRQAPDLAHAPGQRPRRRSGQQMDSHADANTGNCWPNFNAADIQIKDLERGLLDFPAIIGGKEVFLCWEQDEDAVEFWHDLDTGYSGRERL
ncbi:MAG: DUF2203 family protein [Verrucomicrobiota bacterium]